jgi:hypothetical protein
MIKGSELKANDKIILYLGVGRYYRSYHEVVATVDRLWTRESDERTIVRVINIPGRLGYRDMFLAEEYESEDSFNNRSWNEGDPSFPGYSDIGSVL